MQNFTYYAPTEVIFGKDTELKTASAIKKWGGTKVLVVYGEGSAVKSGLLKRVEENLKDNTIDYVLLGGVQPNPRLSLAEKGVEVAVKEKVDFVLAIGGGSAIDTAKAIAHGTAKPECKLWDLWTRKEPLGTPLPVGCILTISAAGSETSGSVVLTNEEIGKKGSIADSSSRPKFAIMNPELTYTVPKYQIACGIADIMMHTLERYFIPNQKNQMTDEIAEALLRVVIENGRKVIENPCDYDAVSEVMWCGSISHTDMTGLGRDKDFSVHKFGHALSAKYDYAHGATLTAVWEAWANYLYLYDVKRFAHYARKVWNVQCEDDTEASKQGIERTVGFFKEIGAPVNLRELGLDKITDDEIMELALDATINGTVTLAKVKALDLNDVVQIFKNSK